MDIELHGRNILLDLSISKKRRRTISLRTIDKNHIKVLAPYYMNEQKIIDFLKKHWKWVFRNMDKYREPENKIEMVKDSKILFMGNYYPVVVDNTIGMHFDGKYFHTNINDTVILKSLIIRWYKTIAREIIPDRVKQYASKFNLTYGKITIGSAKTTLGTCSSKNNLNFTWRLVMAPEYVLNYVIIHELAHTKHHNHSKRFWAFVESMMPDYKISEKWIKEHTPEMHGL